jgi:acetyl-CoA synthetase
MSQIVWKPSKEYIEKANITRFMKKNNIKNYNELIKKSTEEIEWFWDAALKDLNIEWYEPYQKILDDSNGIQWVKWFVGGKLNIVHNCLDRYASSDKKNNIAIIWENENGNSRKLTYEELYKEVNKFANALKKLGIKKRDRVGIYMPMVPEIVVAFLGIMKIGAISIPIFSGFGGHALAQRLDIAGAKILITADGSFRRGKQFEIKKEADKGLDNVSSLKNVIVFKKLRDRYFFEQKRDILWDEIVPKQSDKCKTEEMDSEDNAMIIFSSGTTGTPKGTVHTHGGSLAQIAKELGYYFDVKENDRFFWLTDIGWMMGPWMIIGVQHFGAAIVIFEGALNYPNPDRLWSLVEKHKITQFGISPTAIRLLMKYGEEWVKKHDLSSLRLLGSTGEPWDPESWNWFFEKVGKKRIPIINISGGTEIVGCFLSPLPITELKPCTLRGPGLGMDIDVYDDDGKPIRGKNGSFGC